MRSSGVMSESMLQLYEDFLEYTSDINSRVTATVAGGRKSMSAVMTLAFQLYAREQDELFQILVPAGKMSDPEWFFPSDPEDPERLLEVTQIPVLKVGRFLTVDIRRRPLDLVRILQEQLKKSAPIRQLRIEKGVFTESKEVKFSPRVAVVLRYLIKRRMNASCEADCPGCRACTVTSDELRDAYQTEIIPDYMRIVPKLADKIASYESRRKLAKQRRTDPLRRACRIR